MKKKWKRIRLRREEIGLIIAALGVFVTAIGVYVQASQKPQIIIHNTINNTTNNYYQKENKQEQPKAATFSAGYTK